MKNEIENPLLDSENYTFVSVETLRNTFPATPQSARDSEAEFTREGVKSPVKRASRKISEPES